MGLGKTLLLGFIAGVTILIGMPLGRMRRPSEALRVSLNALAIGVLIFLVWDVLSAAWEPIDEGLAAHHETGTGLGSTFGYGLLFAGGLTVGLLGLQQYEAWMGRRVRRSRQSMGPGAMAGQELRPHGIAAWSPGSHCRNNSGCAGSREVGGWRRCSPSPTPGVGARVSRSAGCCCTSGAFRCRTWWCR